MFVCVCLSVCVSVFMRGGCGSVNNIHSRELKTLHFVSIIKS